MIIRFDRLLMLADFLDTVPKDKFDYSVWWLDDECGTAGCALGWACQMPEFQKLGLRLGDLSTLEHTSHHVPMVGYDTKEAHPMGSAMEACEIIFGLETRDAEFLFTPGDIETEQGYKLQRSASPTDVAEHIRAFVRDRQNPEVMDVTGDF